MTPARHLTKGFTLIELLVVIGILGILATALIATIDPFEQLKKAQDSNVKNSMVEYLNANLRYFTTHNGMPWADTLNQGGYPGCGDNVGGGIVSAATLNTGSGANCVLALVQDGELKPTYTTATNITKEITVFGDSNTVTACFKPASKSGQRDPNTKYSAAAVTVSGCVSQTAGGTNCYYCAQL